MGHQNPPCICSCSTLCLILEPPVKMFAHKFLTDVSCLHAVYRNGFVGWLIESGYLKKAMKVFESWTAENDEWLVWMPNMTANRRKRKWAKTHQSPKRRWSRSLCVQSCTRCRPSSAPPGRTRTSAESAPWHCTVSSGPTSAAGAAGAAVVQSWGGEPAMSGQDRRS